ncbi:MAG: glutathione S-transferase family protein [Burkholderiales bacterium]
MITLYFRPGTCALASYLALEEAGAAHEVVDMSAQLSLLQQINPRGKVPVLDIDGWLLRENVAILSCIAERFPAAGLWPDDAAERLQCLSTLAWLASTVHIDYRQMRRPMAFSPEVPAQPGISEQGRRNFLRDLGELDARLDGRDWLLGDRLSVADLYGLVFIEWAVTSQVYDPQWTHLTRWASRLIQRPAVAKVLQAVGASLLKFGQA